MYHPIMATGAGSYVQFITVFIIFVVVLGITAMTTKWIAGYQKKQTENSNMEVVETSRIASNKYLQIVRVGEKYIVIAVCKDTVTYLCEVSPEQLKLRENSQGMGFRELFEKAVKNNPDKKVKQPHDEA